MRDKKRIETYRERSDLDMLKENNQLQGLYILGALNPYTLTKEDKYKTLRAVNIIK